MKYFIGLCFLTCSVVPGFGTTINFASPSGLLSSSQAYGAITASGYTFSGSTLVPVNLYGKTCTSPCDENGLGLNNDHSGDHEITPGSYIQLDVSSLGPISLSFVMNSTTNGETWKVFESSVANATSGSSTMSGSGEGSNVITLTSGIKYLDFTSTNGNELLSSISYTSATPEPMSLALTGSGLIGLFLLRRRRAGSQKID